MKVRPIEAGDIVSLLHLRGLTRENAISGEGLRALGITSETVAEKLRTTHRGWLCEVAGEIVGFAIGDGGTGELWVIAVLPTFEGHGVGSRLLCLVEDWLWSLEWEELWLWTSTDENLRAYSFYIGHGWRKSELKDGVLYLRKKKPNKALEPTPGSVTPRAISR
jgi:GNAT superfamily N-acetyltransferase